MTEPVQQNVTSCVTGKVMHDTAEGARSQIRSLKAARDRGQVRYAQGQRSGRRRIAAPEGARLHERNGRELAPYRCPSCDHWHVGHS